MARLARLSVPGHAHLLVQRGREGVAVFADDADRVLFLRLLAESARAELVAIHAYAVRDNEVRLLLTPPTAQALSRLMQALGRRYGAAFNRQHGRRGSLWEGRFRATVIEAERHLLQGTVWVEEEASSPGGHPPSAADGVPRSSLAHHLGQGRDPLVTEHPVFWRLGNTPFERDLAYLHRLQMGLSPAERREIVAAVEKGWPLGAPAFVTSLGTLTPRRLVPLKRGRPTKAVQPVPNKSDSTTGDG